LKQRLDAEAAQHSGDEALYWRAATAYLASWNENSADALARMKQLLTDTGDARIALGLAAMLSRKGDAKAALAALADLKPPTAASARSVAIWHLILLAQSSDTAAATTAAQELADAPWEIPDLREVLNQLQKSNCSDAAQILRPRLLQEDLREEDMRQPELALQELSAPTSSVKPDALANRVLALPPTREGPPNNARVVALRALQNSGAFEDYVTKLRRACEAASQDATAWRRFAEVCTGAEATTAWRKVLELDPHSVAAVRELLKLAQTSEEKRDIFEKFLALAPEEAVQEHANLFFKEYADAQQLPHLAEAISKAPFQPAAWRAGLQNSSAWRQRAEQFINARQPEAALLVLRKAITTFDPVPSDLRRLLLFQLVALNRHDEAARELVECLAPSTREAAQLFAWQGPADAPPTRNTIDVDLLKMARTFGVAPELRARVHAAAEHDATARAVSAYLRVVDREPAALAEIRAMLPEVNSTNDTTWVVPLATELAAWPEAAETCRELLTTYNRAVASNARYALANRLKVARLLALTGGKDEALKEGRDALENARKNPRQSDSWRTPHAVGEIALAAGDAALLTDCTHALVEMLDAHTTGGFYDTGEAISFAGRLLDANQTDEVEQILSALRKMATSRNNPATNSALAAFEMETALHRGDWRLATPQVWLDVDKSSADQTTIGWDLGTSTRYYGNVPNFVTRAESVPSLAGRLVVELFVGKDGDSMQPIARITNANSRGFWQGKLPIDSGFARVVISDQDKVLFGDACAFSTGLNLLRQGDAANFLPSVPGGEVKREKGGPTNDGEYVSLRAPERSVGNPPAPSLAPQIHVKPGHDYLLQAWVRTSWSRPGRLGWRCLDSNGKSVGGSSVATYNVSDRYWIHYSQRLSWPRNNSSGQRMPVTTVSLEPTLEGGGGADIAGLSLIEIPIPEAESEP
jgi:tetratricopeptide (TPR) repeat protein